MELLIVGAGAVGSAYGYFASKTTTTDVNVTFLIKPKHRSDLEKGTHLYHWKGRTAEPIHFTKFALIDNLTELRQKKFDAVLITIPSDKFRAEGWLESFLTPFTVGSPEGKIWSLQPSEADQRFLREKLGPEADKKLVRGRIPIMSYLAPLPGESFEKPGFAFYIPPTSKAGWSSKNDAAAKVASDLFDSGGLPSKVVDGAAKSAELLPEALLRSVVAGLERSEWSFDRLLNGENIHLVAGGIREMTAVASKIEGTLDPSLRWWGKLASSPFGVKSVLRLVAKITPFDFEAFLRVHFTKVDTQMHMNLDEQIAYGKKNGVSTTNLVLLRGRKTVR